MKKILVMSLVLLFLLAGCLPRQTERPSKQSETVETAAGGLTVHFIDVGQADSTLLEFDGHAILIDAGDWTGDEVASYLANEGIMELDIVVGTHPDADHIGQLAEVVKEFEVGEVWMSGNPSTSNVFIETLEAIEATGTDYYEPRAGETFDIGKLALEVLYPEEVTGKVNEESIAMKITYGDIQFVFTGDAGVKEEQRMIDRGADLDAEILHMGHHGSNTSTSQAFLKAVSPEIAIYSAGIDNSYGHPHAEVIAAAENAGAEVYGTDVQGTVIVKTDGVSYSVDTLKEGTPAEGQNRCIDINVASSAELQQIDGIGEALADSIKVRRPFKNLDELTRVKGIGEGKLKDIKSQGLACIGE